jgi:hypothetical protein
MPDLKVVIVHRVDTLANDVHFTEEDLSELFNRLGAALADLR